MQHESSEYAEFEVTIDGVVVSAKGRVAHDGDGRVDAVLALANGDVHVSLCDSEYGAIGSEDGGRYFAVVCDHRAQPPQPGLISAGDNRFGAAEDFELGDADLEDLAPAWAAVLIAIAEGRSRVPSVDGSFPGPFEVDATSVRGELGAQSFLARFPSPAQEGDGKGMGESSRNWSDECPISVSMELDGHHLTWTVDDTDVVPGEGSGYWTGWATFTNGIVLTTYRDMDFAMPPYLCFAAEVPAGGVGSQPWRVAWAYMALVSGGLDPKAAQGRIA